MVNVLKAEHLKQLAYPIMCLSIETPKSNKSPFVVNGKLIIFRCPKILVHYRQIIMCLNMGPP